MTATARPVEQSLFPHLRADRAVGPLIPSVITGTNAQLIAAVAPLYLTGSVCDVTYGRGAWWNDYRPEQFTAHDLFTGDGVDFRQLPEPDDTYDAVCFDPPYIPNGSAKSLDASTRQASFRDRYGINEPQTTTAMFAMFAEGLAECARVLTRHGSLLVKCGDWGSGPELVAGHRTVLELGDAVGLRCFDLIVHHSGPGPGGHNIVIQRRARRCHSYLLVFRKRPTRKQTPTQAKPRTVGWEQLDLLAE